MAKLGGEYTDPRRGDQAASVQHGRMIFYSRIERLAPEVLESLRADVLPLHANGDTEVALAAWAERFGLADPWAVNDARWTLRIWRDVPQTLTYTPLRFHPDTWGGPVHEGPPAPTLTLAAELTYVTWEQYERRARAEFDQALREYRKAWEDYAAEHGLVHSPEKRSRSGADPGMHFDLLVRFQVQGWTHSEIGNQYRTSRGHPLGVNAVAKAIRSTADLIGLTRRSTLT